MLKVSEPFSNLLTQGMVIKDGAKMSKSKGNVVDPDAMIRRYGADTTRLFSLFAAPPEKDLEWSDKGVEGGFRFLNRVWRLAESSMDSIRDVSPYSGKLETLDGKLKTLFQKSHMVIQKVTRDIEERFHFNTAISAVMELVNTMYQVEDFEEIADGPQVMRFAMESAVLLIAPVVPHIAEELWERMGNASPVLDANWPSYSEDALVSDDMLIVIQVNGKLRGKFTISTDAGDDIIKETALSNSNAQKFIQDKPVKKVIVVKRKLVNIVV